MKKELLRLFSIITVIILLVSCDSNAGFLGGTNTVTGENIKNGYRTVEIEGCEYIYYSHTKGYSGFGFLAHKGDCKNPIHIYNNRIDTLK